MVFPGCIQGRHIHEAGAKGCALVTVEDGHVAKLERRPLDVARWEMVEVDVSERADLEEIRAAILDALHEAGDAAQGRVLAARVRLTGPTPLHGTLLQHETSFGDDVRALATGIGHERAWIEKVAINTRPTLDEDALRQRQDALALLDKAFADAAKDQDFMATLGSDLERLRTRMPAEVMDDAEDGLLAALNEHDLERIVASARSFLTASLADGE